MQAEVVIEVPFHDVDTMNVVWHGHYLKYFEIARCKLLDQFHYNYNQMLASGYAWPVIESHVRYAQGIQFEQKNSGTCHIKRMGKSSQNRLSDF